MNNKVVTKLLVILSCHPSNFSKPKLLLQQKLLIQFQLHLCPFCRVLCTVVAGTNVSRDLENKTVTAAVLLVRSIQSLVIVLRLNCTKLLSHV